MLELIIIFEDLQNYFSTDISTLIIMRKRRVALKNAQAASPERIVEIWLEGKPINPYEQQDAPEFLEVILDN